MKTIEITLTDEQFEAFIAGLPGDDKAEDRVTEYLQTQIDNGIAPQFLKKAEDARFAAAGLPNLKAVGLDEDQCALVLTDAQQKIVVKQAAIAAEKAAAEAAKTLEEDSLIAEEPIKP